MAGVHALKQQQFMPRIRQLPRNLIGYLFSVIQKADAPLHPVQEIAHLICPVRMMVGKRDCHRCSGKNHFHPARRIDKHRCFRIAVINSSAVLQHRIVRLDIPDHFFCCHFFPPLSSGFPPDTQQGCESPEVLRTMRSSLSGCRSPIIPVLCYLFPISVSVVVTTLCSLM